MTDHVRRRAMGTALATTALVLSPACFDTGAVAHAHHGFRGHFDLMRPLYLQGVLLGRYFGPPHAQLSMFLDPRFTVPRDRDAFRALEDMEERQMLRLLRAIDRHGRVDLALDPRMARLLRREEDRLPDGLHTRVIAYRRNSDDEYRGELRAVAIELSDKSLVVSSEPSRRQGATPR